MKVRMICANFYPRSPCGERPYIYILVNTFLFNFYPRSPCGERPDRTAKTVMDNIISIHALLAESDRKITITVDDGTIISIHALLAESDLRKVPILGIK